MAVFLLMNKKLGTDPKWHQTTHINTS